ncbi:hypothetical protein SGRA_3796 [Saprospira grandis str. Lewin]|uniref:Uncharacterized protein n=1 Tax=Saprospira grandis (strain Lewin) TaxID=984262 RepID=H6L8E8_SAPGL|nr:hypothetical protein SGRA_3796 [Saprospira grandis str. Lewin]
MSGPALRSRGPKGQTQAAKGGCRAEQTCERRSIAAASLLAAGPKKNFLKKIALLRNDLPLPLVWVNVRQ